MENRSRGSTMWRRLVDSSRWARLLPLALAFAALIWGVQGVHTRAGYSTEAQRMTCKQLAETSSPDSTHVLLTDFRWTSDVQYETAHGRWSHVRLRVSSRSESGGRPVYVVATDIKDQAGIDALQASPELDGRLLTSESERAPFEPNAFGGGSARLEGAALLKIGGAPPHAIVAWGASVLGGALILAVLISFFQRPRRHDVSLRRSLTCKACGFRGKPKRVSAGQEQHAALLAAAGRLFRPLLFLSAPFTGQTRVVCSKCGEDLGVDRE